MTPDPLHWGQTAFAKSTQQFLELMIGVAPQTSPVPEQFLHGSSRDDPV
jgi:hypothetical protein